MSKFQPPSFKTVAVVWQGRTFLASPLYMYRLQKAMRPIGRSPLDMSFWRKIVNDYREGFHGVISQPKSPKIANFDKPSENCLQ